VPPPPGDLSELIEIALNEPIGCLPLEAQVRSGEQVLIVVSDDTRDDPRREMVNAVLARLPDGVAIRFAIANGTHGPCDPTRLGMNELFARGAVINHDAADERSLVEVGITARGTPVRINRRALEADLIIATGRIKPHYFAGYGAGAKAVYPGLGDHHGVRINHRLKRDPGAVAGAVENNPCRLDLEEAALLVKRPIFLLNVVLDASGGAQAAVAGDVVDAFRVGAAQCRPLFEVRGSLADLVIVSDALPLSGSLYQASKLAAAAAPLVADRGAMIIAAECPYGTGPIETVNKKIYELGVRPRLPEHHRVFLMSGLSRETVAKTYCEWIDQVDSLVGDAERIVVLPHAGCLIVGVDS
jgi:nickel-dependent lactate racemase